MRTGSFQETKHRKYFPKSETTPWGWHGIKQPSGKHNTINILLTRGFRVMWNLSAIGQISIDTSFPVRLWKFRFNLVRITLFACRRSMIRLNLSHGKWLMRIQMTDGRSEKHNLGSIAQSVERWSPKPYVGGSIPPASAPMNCNSLEFFSYFVRFQCFSLGDLCRSSRHTGFF